MHVIERVRCGTKSTRTVRVVSDDDERILAAMIKSALHTKDV